MKHNISRNLSLLGIATVGVIFGVFLEFTFPFLDKLKTEVSSILKEHRMIGELWNNGFKMVKIKSTLDGNDQSAYFYKAKTSSKAPLIVSLHSWRGDFSQFDSLAMLCKEKDINYIHPDFRGPNLIPDACCSELVLNDIDDAVSYAIRNANVDTDKVSIIGASGGGYTALCAYMKSKHPIYKVSAWAPISDLGAWYEQNKIRDKTYLTDILKCTNSNIEVLNIEEAKDRSPFFWNSSKATLERTSISLYAGIYDGLQGSVPITQSINFYNKLLHDLNVTDSSKYVTERERRLLLEHRKPLDSLGKINNRPIILRKNFKKIQIIIFEGGHEILNKYALNELLK